ncbi:DUF2243 domain-containing protein [Dactylosporangium sp. CS-047395]|uniref:DUF2243 domain-containing protein n=1 Tax=Dactylosporangium sp. CS-047395 TaxID=3239936 RepID=UPI003D92E2CF
MSTRGIAAPGIILGVGLGGFVDGILLHQLLQWHHLLTGRVSADTVSGLRMNTLGDGFFHTFTWLAVLIGLAMLYSRVTRERAQLWASRVLWGWIVAGWGLFNLVEGLIDHQILGIHHVRSGPGQLWWDLGFLALGAVLVGIGRLLRRPDPAR